MGSAILVTGAGGFIGSHLCDHLLTREGVDRVVALDAERTGFSPHNLDEARADPRLVYIKADVRDGATLAQVLAEHAIDHVFHLAAETHVDRSIADPAPFVETNVLGTQRLLEACRAADVRRLVNVITDEVYGEVPQGESREGDPLRPRSPYAASKAAQYHLGMAYHATYGLPVISALPSNTYGPRQYPEKLIPRFVMRLARGQTVPLMASSHFTRDWLWVGDLCRGLWRALELGQPGRAYNLGGGEEITNLEMTRRILGLMGVGEERIETVPDRAGHDRRYRVCSERAREELGWEPGSTLNNGLPATVVWFQHHAEGWWPR
jgi:dTDP-glucose 4,6-dehydratase